MLILVRRSDHQVIEAVAIQIGHGSEGRAEAGVLAPVVDLQHALQDETILERGQKT